MIRFIKKICEWKVMNCNYFVLKIEWNQTNFFLGLFHGFNVKLNLKKKLSLPKSLFINQAKPNLFIYYLVFYTYKMNALNIFI